MSSLSPALILLRRSLVDEDLAALYLTDKQNKIIRSVDDHQTAELLLESMERQIDEVNEDSARLASLLSDVESNISLSLASTRVRLQNLELQVRHSFTAALSSADIKLPCRRPLAV